jgi:hypothetical protein
MGCDGDVLTTGSVSVVLWLKWIQVWWVGIASLW